MKKAVLIILLSTVSQISSAMTLNMRCNSGDHNLNISFDGVTGHTYGHIGFGAEPAMFNNGEMQTLSAGDSVSILLTEGRRSLHVMASGAEFTYGNAMTPEFSMSLDQASIMVVNGDGSMRDNSGAWRCTYTRLN